MTEFEKWVIAYGKSKSLIVAPSVIKHYKAAWDARGEVDAGIAEGPHCTCKGGCSNCYELDYPQVIADKIRGVE